MCLLADARAACSMEDKPENEFWDLVTNISELADGHHSIYSMIDLGLTSLPKRLVDRLKNVSWFLI